MINFEKFVINNQYFTCVIKQIKKQNPIVLVVSAIGCAILLYGASKYTVAKLTDYFFTHKNKDFESTFDKLIQSTNFNDGNKINEQDQQEIEDEKKENIQEIKNEEIKSDNNEDALKINYNEKSDIKEMSFFNNEKIIKIFKNLFQGTTLLNNVEIQEKFSSFKIPQPEELKSVINFYNLTDLCVESSKGLENEIVKDPCFVTNKVILVKIKDESSNHNILILRQNAKHIGGKYSYIWSQQELNKKDEPKFFDNNFINSDGHCVEQDNFDNLKKLFQSGESTDLNGKTWYLADS
ncbi:MAG: hypothetical protein Q8K60_05750 [Parachlamydiaceae bacterium]|nr:hypothetical protein [Parachlamydiaceae bacterium]